MPRRLEIAPSLRWVVDEQDGVIRRDQAFDAGHTRRSIGQRLATGAWRVLLPEVYLCSPSEPTRRQLLVAALLYAGPLSVIDSLDACHFHGIRTVTPSESRVHVVTPWGGAARSRDFVIIRRTVAPIEQVRTDRLRYLAPAAAVVATARRLRSERRVVALLSEAIQRNIAGYNDLVAAHIQGSPHNAKLTDRGLAALGSGALSAPEVDFAKLVTASLVLPRPEYNAALRLPGGRIVKPDSLWVDAALVHETNGRSAHARADLFEDMQERHDAMTVAGLTVLHNSPRRLRLHGREVISQVERCYERRAGIGLPEGVTLLGLAS
ncbi:MAG TPA: hypothetical protein VHC43_01835 [Mycobacteriales bacterium]|nr:hypothetical protein [Mycobacteriales bacterium]